MIKSTTPDLLALDRKLFADLEKVTTLDVKSGSMGICLYLYWCGRQNNDLSYIEKGSMLLDKIISGMSAQQTLDIPTGLSGIGLAFDYLISEKYVKGNINEILSEVDDIIFKSLSYPKYYDVISASSLVDILIFLVNRYGKQRDNSESKRLYKELIISSLNLLMEKINHNFFEEPSNYNLDYLLPKFLYAMKEIYSLNICCKKIYCFLDELSFKILSVMPYLNAHRLYLSYAIDLINSCCSLKKWDRQSVSLYESINFEYMINYEFKDNCIFLYDGLSSIYFFVNNTVRYLPNDKMKKYKAMILNRIISSEQWNLYKDDDIFLRKIGLIDGYCGVALFLKYIQYENSIK